jgi:hypothetical protein
VALDTPPLENAACGRVGAVFLIQIAILKVMASQTVELLCFVSGFVFSYAVSAAKSTRAIEHFYSCSDE